MCSHPSSFIEFVCNSKIFNVVFSFRALHIILHPFGPNLLYPKFKCSIDLLATKILLKCSQSEIPIELSKKS